MMMKNLFGDSEAAEMPHKQTVAAADYEAFVAKFKRKKTTDDCYTPPPVYDCVLQWLGEHADLSGRDIVRPFWPDQDYRAVTYPDRCVVVDNPPFSIITHIARWYLSQGIGFFLFAPHLTLFSGGLGCSHLVCGANIEYENGAVVKTSFLSNLFDDLLVCSTPDLYRRLDGLRRNQKAISQLPRYRYPDHVMTVCDVAKMSLRGVSFRVGKGEAVRITRLDSQRASGKGLFGSGFLLSDEASARKTDAEEQAVQAAIAAGENAVMNWELSEREKGIIRSLQS